MEFMDMVISLWLAFVSIAFLIETIILIGRYVNIEAISGKKINIFLFRACLILIISIISGILGGLILKFFENNVFNLTIVFIVWIPLFYPIYYSVYNISNKEKTEDKISIQHKKYDEITEEDKIIINHLIDTHNRVFSDIDALDTKCAQIIALNGVIISLVFVRTGQVPPNNLIILGLAIIISSMIIGVWSLFPREFISGPSHLFYKKYDKGEGVSKLIEKLSDHYPKNLRTHNQKGNLSKYMLVSLVLGLIVLIASLIMQTL